jgi:hypothetical protein
MEQVSRSNSFLKVGTDSIMHGKKGMILRWPKVSGIGEICADTH